MNPSEGDRLPSARRTSYDSSSEEDKPSTVIGRSNNPGAQEFLAGMTQGNNHPPPAGLADLFSSIFSSAAKKLELQEEYTLTKWCVKSIEFSPIHPDLMNEMFSDVDSGIRAEVYSNRPYFCISTKSNRTISMSLNSISCRIGKEVFGSRSHSPVTRDIHISLIDIYDTYGIGVTYSYLCELHRTCLMTNRMFQFIYYITGSLLILRPELASIIFDSIKNASGDPSISSLLVCSQLLDELILLESKQPKLLTQLERHTTVLPVEVLAKIFNSKRISKEIAVYVSQYRSLRELRLGEMEGRSRYSSTRSTLRSGIYYLRDGERCWSIARQGIQFSLRYYVTSQMQEDTGSVLFSPRDYVAILGLEKTILMLQNINTEDVDLMSRWIIQLSYEVGSTESMMLFDIFELRSLFESLVIKMIILLRDAKPSPKILDEASLMKILDESSL